MPRALELADVFAGHDVHITIGALVGRSDYGARPGPGLDHHATTGRARALAGLRGRHRPAPDQRGQLAGSDGPIDFEGRRYGLRVHELRQFAELPRLAGGTF